MAGPSTRGNRTQRRPRMFRDKKTVDRDSSGRLSPVAHPLASSRCMFHRKRSRRHLSSPDIDLADLVATVRQGVGDYLID